MLNLLGSAVTAVTSSDWSGVLSALQNQISVSTVVEVLAVLAGAAVGLVFMWWGVRKLTQVIMTAFRSGRLGL